MGVAAVAVLAISIEEVYAHICRRRAERVLHDVRQLQVGKSTFEDARAVVLRNRGGVSPYDHRGCSTAHCTFEVVLKHYPILLEVWGQESLLLHVLPRLGLQVWEGGGDVRVDAGIVTCVTYGVLVRGSGGWLLGHEAEEFKAVPKYLQDRTGQRSYFVRWANITTPGGGEGIISTVTLQANPKERNVAADFDCLTRLGGCTSLCQIAPAAFADYVKQTGRMPWLEEHDPNCGKFKPLAASPDDTKHP